MTGRVRALLITPDDDLLAIHRWVMSATLADTPAASRNAATGEPGTAGRALGATPATSPAPAGAAVPAARRCPGGSATRCRRPGRAATSSQPGLTCCAGFSTA